MKHLLLSLICLLTVSITRAQKEDHRFAAIDSFASSVGYYPADTLAAILTTPYNTDLEKVRSIFYWIVQHISYDVEKYHSDLFLYAMSYYGHDSTAIARMEVAKTLDKKMGICQNYSELFKTLCDHAGVNAAIVTGYVRFYSDSIGTPTKREHAWNAVMIDNKWHLLDVTWASGYCDAAVQTFTKEYNSHYFLTTPEMMQWDHYPTDNKWTLTNDSLTFSDFCNQPIINIQKAAPFYSFKPRNGIIKAKVETTIKFEIAIADTSEDIMIIPFPQEHETTPAPVRKPSIPHSVKAKPIQSDNDIDMIFDHADKQKGKVVTTPYLAPKKPYTIKGNIVTYNYKVRSPKITSLIIYYGDHQILEYNVNIIK